MKGGNKMKTISATEAKNRFGKHFTLVDNESLLIESRSLPTHLVFNVKTGTRLVLGAFAGGSISRAEAMSLLGFEWYGQLLDSMRENGIDRGDAVLGPKAKEELERAIPVIGEALAP